MRTFDHDLLQEYGINNHWIQENHALSKQAKTLRGLHFQFPPYAEAKLVRVIRGKMIDVFVDLRTGSETFGKWGSVILSEELNNMAYIPRGFAHGYCTMTDNVEVVYKVDNVYSPEHEGGLIWNDKNLNIDWKTNQPILSEKDKKQPGFNDFIQNYNSITIE